MDLYEITSIKREGGNDTKDDERVGLEVFLYVCSVGSHGIFPVGHTAVSLNTSRITDIKRDGDLVTVVTRNTTYVFRKVKTE